MRVYLVGGAGHTNFGDNLIVQAWLDYLGDVGGKKIYVDGQSADALKHYFGKTHPDAAMVQAASWVLECSPGLSFWQSVRRGFRFFRNGGFDRYKETAGWNDQFSEIGILHLHGGGYLNIIFPKNGFLLGFCAAAKEHYGCKVVATGLGMLPQCTPDGLQQALFAEVADAFDVMEFRDEESACFVYDLAPRAQIIVGLDDTFLVPRPAPIPAERASLHISWFEDETPLKIVTDFLRLRQNKYERIFFWGCSVNDAKLCEPQLRAIAPNLEVFSSEELVANPFVAQPGDHMLTKRFHPHLLAARCGARGAFVAHETYYNTKQESVVKLGSPFVRMGEQIQPLLFDPSPTEIMTRDAEWVAMKHSIADSIYGQQDGSP